MTLDVIRVIRHNLIPFFRDIGARGFDPASYPENSIGRILELGDPEAVTWMRTTFSEQQIKAVILTERRLSPKSATYWAHILEALWANGKASIREIQEAFPEPRPAYTTIQMPDRSACKLVTQDPPFRQSIHVHHSFAEQSKKLSSIPL